MHAWLDDNRGVGSWELTAAGRGVVNDAMAVYFREPIFAAAFAARWCVFATANITEGVLQVRDDDPAQRVPAPAHRTP